METREAAARDYAWEFPDIPNCRIKYLCGCRYPFARLSIYPAASSSAPSSAPSSARNVKDAPEYVSDKGWSRLRVIPGWFALPSKVILPRRCRVRSFGGIERREGGRGGKERTIGIASEVICILSYPARSRAIVFLFVRIFLITVAFPEIRIGQVNRRSWEEN